ncbi:GTP-binding proten HflX [Spirochaeta thermophila DSM 6578]|uniref:GTPase HflX n=1 Tax=Winmispira thermophila (strain ATCC 700085 / DSM 6578 / Z-1203) TaxID=869211 RepID=G0GF04_WINT7|nr:GTPase HflX [Spirochaeta thermophila]AEJ62348.1 GTP-binding proten HflX [Spirochaeta thermophila DSM 6578]
MYDTGQEAPRCILVGRKTGREETSSLPELSLLVEELGYIPETILSFPLRTPERKFLFGPGQAEVVAREARMRGIDLVVFDEDLTPAQQRNWEHLVKSRVMDRTEVIIEIFSRHARTKQAQLQTEKARLEYLLPRLRGAWSHLDRQRGGARGTRGEGERQIELDRRMILSRLARIRREMEAIERHQTTTRSRRLEAGIPRVSLVGYTNAGKSSLFTRLTGQAVRIQDRPFVTLDTTTRTCLIPGWGRVVVSDTVGFIQHLPHTLVDAFHATLEEVRDAHLLLEVVDLSSPNLLLHLSTTEEVLTEIGAHHIPRIRVYNKVDRSSPHPLLPPSNHPEILVSAKTGEGIEGLLSLIVREMERHYPIETLELPYHRLGESHEVLSRAAIIHQEYTDVGLFVRYAPSVPSVHE